MDISCVADDMAYNFARYLGLVMLLIEQVEKVVRSIVNHRFDFDPNFSRADRRESLFHEAHVSHVACATQLPCLSSTLHIATWT